MSIQEKCNALILTWPDIRQAATQAHGLKLNMRALEQEYGFNAANAEDACEDDSVFEDWIALRDQAEIANLQLAHLMINADENGSLALISQILIKTNMRDLV